jgi:hypothetical protein
MEEEEDDGNASASGIVSDDISSYLKDKFPKDGDDLDGNIDPGMKSWLDDKFNK